MERVFHGPMWCPNNPKNIDKCFGMQSIILLTVDSLVLVMLFWAAKLTVRCLKITQLQRVVLSWCSTDFRSAEFRSAAWYVLLSQKLEIFSWRQFWTFCDAWDEAPSCWIWGRWPPKRYFFSQSGFSWRSRQDWWAKTSLEPRRHNAWYVSTKTDCPRVVTCLSNSFRAFTTSQNMGLASCFGKSRGGRETFSLLILDLFEDVKCAKCVTS